jgi:short-subunit dehydrogenase
MAHTPMLRERATRVVVITGADAGIGRAAAREFAEREYKIGLLGRDGMRLDAAAREIEQLGGEAWAVVADVADYDEVEGAAAEVERVLGPIDVWVNNAMVSVLAAFTDIADEEFRRVTEVTYLGYVHGTRAALQRMLVRDRGVIVQVGSALAYRAIPLQSAYCGSKHAIRGFTQSVRCELLQRRSAVQIAMVQMPAVNTPQFEWVLSRLPNRPRPVPPIFQPEVAARAVVHAALHPRREMWVGWSTIRAIIATTLAPGLLDRYLARKGLRAQQTAEPDDDARPNNLFHPVPGDFGAHGRFDATAAQRSPALWISIHRRSVSALATLGTAIGLSGLARRRRNV